LVDVTCERHEGHYDLAARESTSFVPKSVQGGLVATESRIGDVEAAFAAAEVTVDALYTTPPEHSMPLEPHASLAVWNGDVVTVYVATQIVAQARARIAATLGIAPEKVRIIARYIGGGFGSKLQVHAEAILAALASRELHRPVKIVMSRQQM